MPAKQPTIWALVTSFAGVVSMTATIAVAAIHTAEDGSVYELTDASPREGLEKIDPALRRAARAAESELSVIIYLARSAPAAGAEDPVAAVHRQYQGELERLSTDLRTVYARYRPLYSMDEAEEKAYVRGVKGKPLPGDDQRRARSLKLELENTRTAMRKDVAAALRQAGAAGRAAMIDELHAAGARVTAEIYLTNAVGAVIPAHMLQTLAYDKRVIEVLPDPEVDYELDVSSPAVGFQSMHSLGYDGSGIFDFGVVDTGVQEDHPNLVPAEGFFTNSASRADADMEVGHGTHVTGIVASNHGTIRGGAPAIGAIIWEHSGGQATTMSRMHDLVADWFQDPEVVNHSLGYGVANDVDYNSNDSFYDAFIDNFLIMITKSAGNQGWTTGDPGDSAITITHPAPAYNLLTVANMNDRNTTTRTDDIRSTGSSVGPTVSERRKPDISAPGVGITSTNFFWPTAGVLPYNACNGPAEPGPDNVDNFCILSGTSMAAPHVAAAVILMEDAGNSQPRQQKAVLLNTADAWDSNDTPSTSDDGSDPTPVCGAGGDPCETLWDKSYGWGYLDVTEAAFNISDFFNDSIIARNDTATEDDYELYKGAMFTNEKATLTWHKRAATYNAGAPSSGRYAIGDLNIRLYANSDGDLLDADFSGLDNVQQVVSTESGTKIIKVYSWSTAFDGITSMPFTLATEENFIRVNPPTFSAAPLIPVVGPFQSFTAPTNVSNTGNVGAHNISVAIGNIAGVSGDGTSQNIGTLLEGTSEQVDFALTTSGLTSGTYSLPVTVTSNSYAETYTSTSPFGLQFVVETTPPTSDCSGLPPATNTGSVDVDWSASDGFFGTGVDLARLYVATPGAPAFVYTGQSQPGTSGTFAYNLTSGDGPYRFAIRARDNGGNWEAFPAATECLTFKDTVEPQSTVSAPLLVAAGTIPLTFTATDAAPSSGLEFVDFWYWKEPAGPWTYTGLFSNADNGVLNWAPPGPGIYHFLSRAKDTAQNIEPGVFGSPPADAITNYGSIDSDADGRLDLADNCLLVANPDQRDTNGDGIGNLCDPDVNNNCSVNLADLAIYKANFFAVGDLDTDNDGDGRTNFTDLNIAKAYMFDAPGPGLPGSCP